MHSESNARVLATVVSWTTGPNRIAVNAPEFDTAGNKMRLDGTVLSSFMPDWLTSAWQQDLPQLAGKVKLMPSPAWEKGGRRTTVMGGTMLGISKRMKDVDSAWRYANPREFPWLQCYVMPALIIAALWMSTGFNMIYFLAALMVLVPKTGG